MVIYIHPKKVGSVLVTIISFLLFMSLASQLYKYLLFNGHDRYLIDLFFLDGENNIPTWYASVSLLFCSMLTGLHYLSEMESDTPYKKHWLGLSIIFLLLASDEMLQFHEQINTPLRELIGSGGFFYFSWIVPALIALICLALAYYKFLLSLPAKTRNRFIASGIVYVTGCVGIEMIGGNFYQQSGGNNLTYSLITHIEETMEMVGILIFIVSLLSYFQSKYPNVKVTSVPSHSTAGTGGQCIRE